MSLHGMPILVPVDLSGEAERAIRPALRLGRRTDAPIILFTWSRDAGEAAAARDYLNELAEDLPCSTRVEVAYSDERSPAPSIVGAAERSQAMICMASHGRSGLGHALLGSVAEEALALAGRPIVLVGPQVAPCADAPSSGVVACVDGSALSTAVLPAASAWAATLGVPLQLVRVVEPNEGSESSGDLWLYDESCVAAIDRVVTPQVKLLHGRAADSIAFFAGPFVDLIAVATHGRSGLSRVVLGSVAMQIVHKARSPVLVVPATTPRGCGGPADEVRTI